MGCRACSRGCCMQRGMHRVGCLQIACSPSTALHPMGMGCCRGMGRAPTSLRMVCASHSVYLHQQVCIHTTCCCASLLWHHPILGVRGYSTPYSMLYGLHAALSQPTAGCSQGDIPIEHGVQGYGESPHIPKDGVCIPLCVSTPAGVHPHHVLLRIPPVAPPHTGCKGVLHPRGLEKAR